MKIIILFISLFSINIYAQENSVHNIANKFYNKHKNAYLYCQNLTNGNTSFSKTVTCYPLDSLTLKFEDLSNSYVSQAHYQEGKLVLSFKKDISTNDLLSELSKYSERLLDPL